MTSYRLRNIRVERGGNQDRVFSFVVAVAFSCALVALLVFSFVVKNAYDQTKQEFIEGLKKEQQVAEVNKVLKTELAAMTHKGYLEFAAHERLGLKRPKDEEVVVLR